MLSLRALPPACLAWAVGRCSSGPQANELPKLIATEPRTRGNVLPCTSTLQLSDAKPSLTTVMSYPGPKLYVLRVGPRWHRGGGVPRLLWSSDLCRAVLLLLQLAPLLFPRLPESPIPLLVGEHPRGLHAGQKTLFQPALLAVLP